MVRRPEMPRKGWTSITIPDEIYELARKYYEEHKEELKLLHGIRSFTAFMAMCLREYLIHLGIIDKETAEKIKAKIERE